MPLDPSYKDLNRAFTERIKKLAASLKDDEMQTRVVWTTNGLDLREPSGRSA